MFHSMRLLGSELYFFLYDVCNFYADGQFRKLDIRLILMYLTKNAYKIAKEYSKSQGYEDVYTYGETPLLSAYQLAKAIGIRERDVFYDLGAGRARMSLFISHFTGAQTIAVEQIPIFCKRASRLQKKYQIKNFKVLEQNYLEVDLSYATVVYLCDLFFNELAMEKLIKKCDTLKKGCKVITVGFALSDIAPNMHPLLQMNLPFLWGKSQVFIQEKR